MIHICGGRRLILDNLPLFTNRARNIVLRAEERRGYRPVPWSLTLPEPNR